MKRPELFFTAVLVPLDFLTILGAALAAYHLRLATIFTSLRPVLFSLTLERYGQIVVLAATLWIGVFALAGLYRTTRRRLAEELKGIFIASATSMAAIFALLFFAQEAFDSRFIALAGWGLAVLFLWIQRLLVRGFQRSLYQFGIGTRKTAIIGSNEQADVLTKTFSTHKRYGVEIVRTFSVFDEETERSLRTLARKRILDDIILTDTDIPRATLSTLKIFSDVEHITLRYSADIFTVGSLRMEAGTVAGIPIISVKKTPLDGWGAIEKRAFDIIGSAVLIILTAPIMLIEAMAIRLDSRGPIFFSRLDDGSPVTRIGENGEPFFYFKFRSMYPNVHHRRYTDLAALDTRKGPLVKIKNDPRITRIGRIIRSVSLDELPELFLVFIGKMSLVGPRPHLPEEVERYEPHHRKVHTVKPGITGLSQISGRADLDFEDEVRLDTFYIENWSPWLDLVILLKTLPTVLFRKGAY